MVITNGIARSNIRGCTYLHSETTPVYYENYLVLSEAAIIGAAWAEQKVQLPLRSWTLAVTDAGLAC
ncbi:hypothetical protein FHX77_000077 [Bifidobacterium commune]|uniref:Uncharacterized protein n=1 Tax=Bifidobacterium commune TaxID=1505727 RepID=A0A1C4H116_9BIFI|nr:hypothetical protein [Bifidobacterium commune]SCC78579.1 hypothetical protein GA0061077_0328 [Bifidobacterium commune]